MRKLHGVLSIARTDYKPYLLLFDKLHVFGLERYRLDNESNPEIDRIRAELEFLEEERLIEPVPLNLTERFATEAISDVTLLMSNSKSPELAPQTRDVFVRHLSATIPSGDGDVVPICEAQLPDRVTPTQPRSSSETVLRVALEAMPVPDDSCAWQDILDFKAELRDKQWNFRRFLHRLAANKQTESEIRDDLESTLNEYREGMNRRRMKMVNNTVAACVIPAVDFLFNPEGSHAVSLVTAAFAINHLRLELLEAEMKAPGRECAYVFDVRKRFGAKLV